MAPTSKENDVLTVSPESVATVPTQPFRPDETAARPNPVALEVPVTVNGARTVEGSDKREPFSETTKTVLVFGNGAVIRLSSPVSAGQLLFLTNEKTKKEVVCQVVKSKNYRSVSGYVELEFTEPVVGFWGMRFPSDRIGAPAPVAPPAASVPSPAKLNAVVPVPPALKPATPVVSAAPKLPEVKPVEVPSTLNSAPPPRPVEVKPAAPLVTQPNLPSLQNAPAPVTPPPKILEAPLAPPPAITSSIASSVASLLSAPELQPVLTPSQAPAPLDSPVNKQPFSSVASENSTEGLKLQAARLQEQLSSMLFTPASPLKPAAPPPVAPVPDSSTVSGVTPKVFEMAKSEPAPVKSAPAAKTPPAPIKSSLDTEEVKIPSWLEPLARNAAAPSSTQELIEREKAKHAAQLAAREELSPEPRPVADVEPVLAPAPELSAFGSLLPLEEPVAPQSRPSGSSRKGILFAGLAASALILAGGAWYLLHSPNAAPGRAASVSHPANAPVSAVAAPMPAAQPSVQPAPQVAAAASEPISRPTAAESVSGAKSSKAPANPQPAPLVRETAHNSGSTIPAAETERISLPAPEPQPKKPSIGEVHLASPSMNRPAPAQDDEAPAPTLASGADVPNVGGLDSDLVSGGKQPAAPEVPLPVGGDVQPAKLLSSVAPSYPILAKNQRISGDVLIDALIDANGHVTTMKFISGPTMLHRAAMDALRQWKYQPATLDGKPVPMHLTVKLQFRLQ
jgi:periplasmic protein TonB